MRASSCSQVEAGKLEDSCCGAAMAAEAATSSSRPRPRGQETGGDGRCLRGGTAGEDGEEDAAAAEVGGEEGCGGRPGEASLEPGDAVLSFKSPE